MKILFYGFIVAALTAVGCQNRAEKFTISGEFDVDGIESTVSLVESTNNTTLESTKVGKDGQFSISGRVKRPYIAQIIKSGDGDNYAGIVFVESGDISILVEEDGDIKATGTPLNDRFHQIIGEFIEGYKGSFGMETNDRIKKSREFIDDKIDENLDNPIGLFLLSEVAIRQLRVDNKYARKKLSKFTDDMLKSPEAYKIYDMIELSSRVDLEEQFPSVTLVDTKGESVALSSIAGQGNWVLVNVWTTWGEPCLKEMPYLLEAYEKYHDQGFEICGVSLDTDIEAWRKYCADLPWINLSATGTNADELYQIKVIPSNFLISPEGEIIAKNLRNTTLLKAMDNLFKK